LRVPLAVVAALLLIQPAAVWAQFEDDPPQSGSGIRLDKPRTVRMQIGIIVTSTGSPMRGIYGTTPVPTDWPEQKVRIVDEDISSNVGSVRYRIVGGTTKQMVVRIPRITRGGSAKVLITFEITRHSILAPEDVERFVVPEKLDRKTRTYLSSSPMIEVRNQKIRKLAQKLWTEAEEKEDWQKVETIYDWVRQHVKYRNGPLKGALAALNDGTGDCEELTSLFVALCRVNSVPARTVWIPGHCYPEFYLADAEGKGHWFPCQAAGSRAFGSMPEHRAILQKGDNFKVPDVSKRQRYVAEFLKVTDVPGGKPPKVQFIRKVLPN